MFRISAFFRVLGRLALVLYLLVAVLFLVVRYGLMPNIDHWRPRIQAELSSALDARITLGHIDADWKGVHPHVRLRDVAIADDEGRQVLRLPSIRATLDWRGLLAGFPRFSYIEADGLDIEARKDAHHRIWVLGRDIDAQEADEAPELALDHPLVQWLAKQPLIALRDAVITWRDETRDGTALRLEAVTLGLVSDAEGHRMLLSATPPQALGRRFEMRGQFKHSHAELERTDPRAWDGTLYANVDGMSPVQWRPWMDVPGHMRSGDVSAQWWLEFSQAQPRRVAAHVMVEQGDWLLGDSGSVSGDEVELFLDGSWKAYAQTLEAFEALVMPTAKNGSADADEPPVQRAGRGEGVFRGLADGSTQSGAAGDAARGEADGPPVQFTVDVKGLALDTPDIFEHVLQFDRIQMRGGLSRGAEGGLAARFDDTVVRNRDMDLQWRGTWREGGEEGAGVADIRGVFRRATLDGIDLYMPTSVNLDAREWLANGLLEGEIHNATAVLQGDLAHFPFGDEPGQFRIEGAFSGGVIDYAPGPTPDESWPALHGVKGRVVLDRVDLRLMADEAVVSPAQGHAIYLRDVHARIPNIERDSVLGIEGMTRAPAPAYLALARHSPLHRLLDGFLDPASAEGEWDVPLRLTIPLLNVDDTQVRGAVNFEGGRVSLDPEAPPFEKVRGKLEFSETGFSAEGLKAEFLGGPAEFKGGIGGGRKGLEMTGRIDSGSLAQYVGMQGMERLHGRLAYKALLRRQPSGRYAMTAQGDLRELAIDLPAPAGKPAGAAGKLDLQWTPAPARGRMYLKIGLGDHLKAWFLRRQGGAEGPYFVAGAVGTVLPQELPSAGMMVDARHSRIDVNEWEAVVDEFSTPAAEAAGASVRRELFPPLQHLRLQADDMQLYGLKLGAATLTARRERPLLWRLDIASAPTAGTLYWHQADAATTGRVDAHFDRLALGAEGGAEPPEAKPTEALLEAAEEDGSWDGEVDVPAVNLKVDKLRLYGRQVGKLAVEGVNEQRGRFWRLNKLSLAGPFAQLQGSGIWRLTGPERGLTLDAETRFSDVGRFLEQIDVKDVMENGQGTLKGRFEWRNMPWRFQRSDLNGQLRLELEKGRFSTVNSRSARLLELLSLQSIQRLATFNLNPASLFKEGFPFDRLAGTLHIRDGVMTTNDYQVLSPVATINIGGDVDLNTEKIDLQAMVVPKLDVSGATVAAGIAINPIVGLGAFVTQWLLSKPLSKAMTAHYDVTGDLNEPQLKEAPAPAPQAHAAPDAGRIEGGEIELNDDTRSGLHRADDLGGQAETRRF